MGKRNVSLGRFFCAPENVCSMGKIDNDLFCEGGGIYFNVFLPINRFFDTST